MGNYRSRLDIIADILHVVSEEGVKKTQIMYRANLSYKLLTRYLSEVLEARLIRFELKKRRYLPTSKGKSFLEKYKDYSRRNKHIEKQLGNIRAEKRALEKLCSSS